MRKVKVLYLPLETVSNEWRHDVIAAIGQRHDLIIYDNNKPLAEQFEGVEVVLDTGGSVGTRQMYDAAKDVRLWQVLGTGLDHVDIAYMKTKDFMIANCPGDFSCVGLAECAMMFILMLSRRVYEAAHNFKNQVMYKPLGCELEGRILGIIGFGSSGRELARRAKGFGMKIHAIDVRRIEPEVQKESGVEFMGTPDDLDKVISRADFVSLHLHLNDETRHILNARRMGLMQSHASIINVARGALVDEEAMYKALLEGKLGGAGLDVFSREPPQVNLAVYNLPNVITTPHIAGSTDGTSRKRAAVAAENVDRIARKLEPMYLVD